MTKKISISSLGVICFVFAVIIPIAPAQDNPIDIEQAKSQIISLIESGKFAEAETAVDKIMVLPMSQTKGQELQQIAGAYQNAGQADKAIQLCDYVINNWPAENFTVWAAMSMAISQIKKGEITAVEETIKNMIVDCADNTDLPAALWVIADTYSWHKMYERAGQLYGIIVEKFPDSSWTTRARTGMKGMEILRLIENGNITTAKEKVNSMIIDFNDEPNLPDVLFRIGQEISWRRQYGDSKYVFDRLNENFPDSPQSPKVKLWSARVDICSIIRDKKNEQVLAAIDKMISDFNGDPGLSDSVQWISKECEWTNGEMFGKANRFDTAGLIYQQLQNFSNPEVVKQAYWDSKRMAYRTKILTLMDKGDESEIDSAIEQMAIDLAVRPELAIDLFWIASWYDEQYHKPDKGMALYERIALDFPDSNEGKESVVRALHIAIGKEEKECVTGEADGVISRLRQQVHGKTQLPNILYMAADAYYMESEIYKQYKGDITKSKIYRAKAVVLYGEVISLTKDSILTANDYLRIAHCCRRSDKLSESISYYKQVTEKWPESSFEEQCLINICLSYEELNKQKQISQSVADIETETVYKKLVEKYPEHETNVETLLKLGWLNFRQGEIQESISWFEKGLSKLPEESKSVNVLYALGQMYENMGEKSKAITTYKQLLFLLDKTNPKVQAVEARITFLENSG